MVPEESAVGLFGLSRPQTCFFTETRTSCDTLVMPELPYVCCSVGGHIKQQGVLGKRFQSGYGAVTFPVTFLSSPLDDVEHFFNMNFSDESISLVDPNDIDWSSWVDYESDPPHEQSFNGNQEVPHDERMDPLIEGDSVPVHEVSFTANPGDIAEHHNGVDFDHPHERSLRGDEEVYDEPVDFWYPISFPGIQEDIPEDHNGVVFDRLGPPVLLNAMDCICERGGLNNSHGGTIAYRARVRELLTLHDYVSLSKRDKRLLCGQVVDWVHSRGGRFVKREQLQPGSYGPWYVVGRKQALVKVCQYFRDRAASDTQET